MREIAISACLLGTNCRYNGEIKRDDRLIEMLDGLELVPFCPEDYCYGTPRPSMDLIETAEGIEVYSNATGENLSAPLRHYAQAFFEQHPDIELFIGKDRSPSCGVKSAKVYDPSKTLRSTQGRGVMAEEAEAYGIPTIDAEQFALSGEPLS